MSFIVNPYLPFPAAGGGTDFYVGHGREALNTSTGNQDIDITWSDGGSYTPQCVWFEVTNATADATAVDGVAIGIGAYDGTNNVSATHSMEHNVGTTNTDEYTSDVSCISLIIDGVVDFLAAGVSFGTDKVTINITDAPASAYLIKAVAFTGADAYEVGVANPSTTDAGTVNKTGLGESCNVLITGACSGAGGNFDETVRGHNKMTIGYYTYDGSTERQRLMSFNGRTGRASGESSVCWCAEAVSTGFLHGVLTEDQAWVISNHASGFTITTHELSTIDVDHDFFYLALSLPSGVEAYTGDFTSPVEISYPFDKAVTDPGFTPQAILACSSHMDQAANTLASWNKAESASPDADGFCMGSAISTSSEYCTSMTEHDGEGTTDNQSRMDSVISYVPVDDGSNSIQANLKSFDANGFTWEYTANSNYQDGRVIYLAFQENA